MEQQKIAISYMYRDGGNYKNKIHSDVVLGNKLGIDIDIALPFLQKMINLYYDGIENTQFPLPDITPNEKTDDWDKDLDHHFMEFCEVGLSTQPASKDPQHDLKTIIDYFCELDGIKLFDIQSGNHYGIKQLETDVSTINSGLIALNNDHKLIIHNVKSDSESGTYLNWDLIDSNEDEPIISGACDYPHIMKQKLSLLIANDYEMRNTPYLVTIKTTSGDLSFKEQIVLRTDDPEMAIHDYLKSEYDSSDNDWCDERKGYEFRDGFIQCTGYAKLKDEQAKIIDKANEVKRNIIMEAHLSKLNAAHSDNNDDMGM